MTAVKPIPSSLARLRLQLTAWYVATLIAILVLLGGGLFMAIRRQLADQLDRSLSDATAEVARAARTRELEALTARGQVVDAVEELRIPERQLYLLDLAGKPVVPADAPDWVRTAALAAARDSVVVRNHHARGQQTLRVRAQRFTLTQGGAGVAVAAADRIELEDRYSSLIAVFGAAAVIGLALVGAGGWFLVQKSTQPAEASMERMRQFMADAAHELRTPVTVLRNRADVTLQRERDPAELTTAMRAMGDEADRLGRIVDDLMTIARADAGERTVERRRVSLDDIALDAAEAARAMATARGVTLDAAEFEEAWVEGDVRLLHQLLMILLDNAIKFTPRGGTVSFAVGMRDGHPVASVRDTGIGIAASDLPHIFDRFYRGDPARTRGSADAKAGGAGLGLAIAQWIAGAHDAAIAVFSEPGKGSKFRVTFPPSSGSHATEADSMMTGTAG